MKLGIKKNQKVFLRKYIGPTVLVIGTIVLATALYQHFRLAQGAEGSPEKFTTDLSGNPKNSFKVNESAYLNIKIYAEDTSTSPTPAPNPSSTPTSASNIKVTEKLTSQVEYNQFVSAVDKGGTVRTATVDKQPNVIYFTLDKIPKSYVCNSSKPECRSNGQQSGGSYTIYDNYVVLLIKFTPKTKGIYDLDSNYNSCNTGTPKKVASVSKVEYKLSTGGSPYKSFDMPAMCVTIGSGVALDIVKTTYNKDGQRQASFEAGDEVTVKLEIDEPEESRTDYEINEAVPKSVSSEITYKFSRQQDGFLKDNLRATPSEGKVKFVGSEELRFLGGRNTIEYKYKI